ncbi:MAG: hypothetical protein COU81_00450 [Candidatus Portnoybacteria bacterium CG10_big_fil_rev_8_21_14_0_10_36_7]|uniref:Uncharacterized protein n=1 Tax=Candidatus Portnoybacteria bacterium CG10_big_fil_rev_8_21_14_0_10_36_7 TaxID=1974812 RepID=A0A2M8KF03_9BACT|nr:MAG: hypothetical protein COU81_00450 [Candidatus Portnoybacteria bacterium CG10_big_fil_rev_8_21_14_0_10_36_7]
MQLIIEKTIEGPFLKLVKTAKKNGGGIIILYSDKDYRYTPHPEGAVIVKSNQLLLNGTKLLYEDEYNNYESHPKGILIEKYSQLFLVVA